MSCLPMQPISDQATRSDFDRLDRRVDNLEQKLDKLSAEMHRGFADIHKTLREQQTTYSKLTIGAMTALTAIFSVIVGLIT